MAKWSGADMRCPKCNKYLPDRCTCNGPSIEERHNMKKSIFVFGSNLSGIHGAGAAACAMREHNAVWRQAIGLQGNSYAIPTKAHNVVDTLPIDQIAVYVTEFIQFATEHPEMTFVVTRIGCGLAGYQPRHIAPLFKGVPSNCIMPEDFLEWMR